MAVERRPWLRHYPPEVPPSVEIPDVPLYDPLFVSASRYPDREAIVFLGKRIPYRALLGDVYRFAKVLKARGVGKGDRVAIMLPNSPQYVIAYYATLLLGGIVVQTNPMSVPREIEFFMNDAEASILIALDLHVPRVVEAIDRTPLRAVLFTSLKDYLPFPKNVLYPIVERRKGRPLPKGPADPRFFRWTEEMRRVDAAPVPPVPVDPREDVALLQYTGGTTGVPKGVMLTHRNLMANLVQARHWLYKAREGREKVVGALPFFHVYGMTTVLNLGVALAATMLLFPRFDATEVLQAIQKERPTLFPGAPTMYIALINHPDIRKYDLSSIEAAISGSAPLPREVEKRFEALTGGRIVEGYGLSETSPVTHANPMYTFRKPGSIGLPWPDTDAAILDLKTRRPLPPGEIGEVAIKGPQVMKGYWRRPEETAAAFHDGWFLTGDIGRMDEDGFFYIVDRKKDMIIAGGFNIYPREVEEVLFAHPAVQEAAVVGVPDPYRGETVKAIIVLKEGASVTEQELDAYCRSKLAAYKVPRIYEFRTELPKTAVGKVLRRVLAEEARAGLAKEPAPIGAEAKEPETPVPVGPSGTGAADALGPAERGAPGAAAALPDGPAVTDGMTGVAERRSADGRSTGGSLDA
ncbi:MAG: long-chain fatty acid--CoA ligase [Hydrogenibacillus schlegelii]|uniref:Long-chain fatty acid--CoA ligase n=1 Tax=Hydrogenibacillus schlegelii TaxID=1484 RepID=A0A947CX02_HYDSH|nr:long-chain fatty acid--CoA ligase [Hydrogenibacillus schlegelii]